MRIFRKSPVFQELKQLEKEEEKLRKQAEKYQGAKWKETLEQKIPPKVFQNLKKAFVKAFELIFEKGNALIEKTYQKEELKKDFQIQDYAFELKGKRKELKKMHTAAAKRNFRNLTLSTVEGAGLGLLGIGLPDIVMFIGMILKGTYETALHYGFSYDTDAERLFILNVLEASVSRGSAWDNCNAKVDEMLAIPCDMWITSDENISKQQLAEQVIKTGDAFAVDMLVAKFIQGLPVVGIVGGLSNPVYYQRIMRYVQLKYRKRYLFSKREVEENEC